MDELVAKIRIFEAIANNCDKLCDRGRYMNPINVANHTNEVYKLLTE